MSVSTCGRCGAAVGAGSVFCGQCGVELGSLSPAPAQVRAAPGAADPPPPPGVPLVTVEAPAASSRPAWLIPAATIGAFVVVAGTIAAAVTGGDDGGGVTTIAPGIVTVAPQGGQPVVPPVDPGGVAGGGGGDVPAGGALGPEALVGVWQGQTVDSVGNPAVIQVSIMANGTYTQTVESIASRDYVAGNWIIVDQSTVRFTIIDYYPTEFCGPLGCTPIRPMPGFTINFRFLTPNRVEVQEPGGAMTSVLDRLG